jgi:hypothetical protein
MVELDMSLIEDRCDSAAQYAVLYCNKISCLCMKEKGVLTGKLFFQFLN